MKYTKDIWIQQSLCLRRLCSVRLFSCLVIPWTHIGTESLCDAWNVTQLLWCQSGNTLTQNLHFAKESLPAVKNKRSLFLLWLFLTQYSGHHLSFLLSSSLFISLPPSLPPALYLSAIRQIVASLICIVSTAIPTGAPRSCSLKDSGATAPSHSPIPWIKLTLGQHQHIMNYGHLPPQTHCSLCSNVGNIEGPGLNLLTAYSLSYLLWGVCALESGW